jgi:metallo-beta-lactamase class B
MKHLLYFLFSAIFSVSVLAQPRQKVISISDNLQLIQVTNHVWIHVSVEPIEGFGMVSSNGVIYTENGKAYLFDTPVSDSLTEVLVKVISDSLKANVIGFVPNHWHQDCLGGLKYLQSIGVESYANQLTIEEAKKRNLPVPAHGFAESLKLNLDGKSIECWYPGAGHSQDNIVVWLSSEKVLFAGCMVKEMKSKSLGNLSDADLKSWPGTIEKVMNKYKKAEVVIPGHGLWGGPELLQHTLNLLEVKERK